MRRWRCPPQPRVDPAGGRAARAIPDKAVVRGFCFPRRFGCGASSARLLPRVRGPADLRSDRRSGPRPRSSRVRRVQPRPLQRLPGRAGRYQSVRLTYEHILTADGDRVDYVLPRSESVRYTVPWKIAVKISTNTLPSRQFYSPSHRLRIGRPVAVGRRRGAGGRLCRPPSPARSGCRSSRQRGEVSTSLFTLLAQRSAAFASCSSRACHRGRTSRALRRTKRRCALSSTDRAACGVKRWGRCARLPSRSLPG